MALKPKQPPGPPMTLGNMRALGVQNLLASCLNDACRHTALINVFDAAHYRSVFALGFWSPDFGGDLIQNTLHALGFRALRDVDRLFHRS
jgi:hypothetical protein